MAMTVLYNGVQFAPVSARQSIVVPHSAEVLWSVVGKLGRMALWMGSCDGQPIFTQLLVCSVQELFATVLHGLQIRHRITVASFTVLKCLMLCKQLQSGNSSTSSFSGRRDS